MSFQVPVALEEGGLNIMANCVMDNIDIILKAQPNKVYRAICGKPKPEVWSCALCEKDFVSFVKDSYRCDLCGEPMCYKCRIKSDNLCGCDAQSDSDNSSNSSDCE